MFKSKKIINIIGLLSLSILSSLVLANSVKPTVILKNNRTTGNQIKFSYALPDKGYYVDKVLNAQATSSLYYTSVDFASPPSGYSNPITGYPMRLVFYAEDVSNSNNNCTVRLDFKVNTNSSGTVTQTYDFEETQLAAFPNLTCTFAPLPGNSSNNTFTVTFKAS